MTNDEIEALEKRLKSPATVFYEYVADDGNLLREAADALASLRTENERLTLERDNAIFKCYDLEKQVSDQTVKAKTAERERDEAFEEAAKIADNVLLPFSIGGDLILDPSTAETIANAIRALAKETPK